MLHQIRPSREQNGDPSRYWHELVDINELAMDADGPKKKAARTSPWMQMSFFLPIIFTLWWTSPWRTSPCPSFKKKKKLIQELKESSSNWPIKVLASNSIYRVSQTILLIHQSRNNQTTERLFEVIAVMTSDIIGACLTNLPHVMCLNCLSSTVYQREDCMRTQFTFLVNLKQYWKF